ncbi:hypothetical protein [Amycolatopsis sp. NPDC059657]|uniref:hypothetical protein n=1 Tax=Amycolatopsis sp. NPDC059657 TaxID=3346899 RepID=UPI00367144DF
MRTIVGVATVIAVCATAGCTERSTPPAPVSPQPAAIMLVCSDPIATVPSPPSDVLDVAGLDLTSTVQANDSGGAGPHRLFAKTALFVHAGHEADLSVPAPWSARVSITWGNHASEWTTSLRIPACPVPPSSPDAWLVFPGGFSIAEPACVPLEVRSGSEVKTVHVSVGSPCPA